MLKICLALIFLEYHVESVVQNEKCPEVSPKEIDLKELDGRWYLAAVATDIKKEGDCSMIIFSHKSNNTTDISLSWIINGTASFYNGSVSLAIDSNSTGDLLLVTYTDHKTETYYLLDVNYEHYVVIFACYDDTNRNTGTYELWKLTRTPHLKDTDAKKIDEAVAKYNLQNTTFMYFNNTEDSCKINKGTAPNSASLIMTSVAAITLFRRLY